MTSLNLFNIQQTPLHNCIHTQLQNDYFKEKLKHFYNENKLLKEKLNGLTDKLENKQEQSNKISKNLFSNTKNDKNENDSTTKRKDNTISSSSSSSSNLESKIPIRVKKQNLTKSPFITTTTTKNLETSKITTRKSQCSVCYSNKINLHVEQNENNYNCNHLIEEYANFDNDIYNKKNKKSYVKLCAMQHDLLKKYQDEVNSNTVKQDLINHMSIELKEYETKCKQNSTQIEELKAVIANMTHLENEYKQLFIDYESVKLKCRNYKKELKCFDQKFFDDIEDLKYNYFEALKLNKQYESVLFNLKNENFINKNAKHRVKFKFDDNKSSNSSSSSEKNNDDEEKDVNYHLNILDQDEKIGFDLIDGKGNEQDFLGDNSNSNFNIDKYFGIDCLSVNEK